MLFEFCIVGNISCSEVKDDLSGRMKAMFPVAPDCTMYQKGI